MQTLGIILTIARFTLLEGLKNRLFSLVCLGVITLSTLALFIGELAITETIHIQNAITAMLLRLFAVFIVCIFVITSVTREANDKYLEMIIALPISRNLYLFGKIAGFYLFSIFIALIISIPFVFTVDPSRLAMWSLSLICELLILTTFALFCLVTFRSITSNFYIVVAFYLLARTISTIQLMGTSPILESASLSHKFINTFISFIALLMPPLDQFSKTEWLLYGGASSEYIFFIGQTIIYIILLLMAACVDLHNKDF